jgi:hemin uptake protein HemP
MHSVNLFEKVLRIIRICDKFIISNRFLTSRRNVFMTSVNLQDDRPQHHADADASVDGQRSPANSTATHARQTLTLSPGVSRPRKSVTVSENDALPASPRVGAMIPTPLKRLTAGRKEIAIAHAGSTYVLRVTKANKLILTKDANDPTA